MKPKAPPSLVQPGPGILWAMQHAVIYAFKSPGSGAVYVGKHKVHPMDLVEWSRAGVGPLPDGYLGSGRRWLRIVEDDGSAAVEWRILARVGGTQDVINKAERRAIQLARAVFGALCLNHKNGGGGRIPKGEASERSRTRIDPKARQEHHAERMRQWWAEPGRKEAHAAQSKRQWSDPAMRRKLQDGMASDGRPSGDDWQRKIGATHKALAQTQERKAQLSVASRIGHRKRRARKALAPFRRAPALQSPGVVLWDAPCGSPLGIAGPGLH